MSDNSHYVKYLPIRREGGYGPSGTPRTLCYIPVSYGDKIKRRIYEGFDIVDVSVVGCFFVAVSECMEEGEGVV
jgi:hypothetical protein